MILLALIFAVMGGGCGGGGDSGGYPPGQYTPDYPAPPTPEPGIPDDPNAGVPAQPLTQEAIDEAWAAVGNAYGSAFVENGVKAGKLNFDAYAKRLVNALKDSPAVSGVKLSQGNPVEDSEILIEFKSGLTQAIRFFYEEEWPFGADNDIKGRLAGAQIINAQRGAPDPSKPVNVRMIEFVFPEHANVYNNVLKKYDDVGSDTSVMLSYDNSLQPLRTLHGYNFVAISAYGWSQGQERPNFWIPCSSVSRFSEADLQDFNAKRIGVAGAGKLTRNPDGSVSVTDEMAGALRVYPGFFVSHYAGGKRLSNKPVIYLPLCELGSGKNQMASAFISAGAAAVVAFDKPANGWYSLATGAKIGSSTFFRTGS
jgi:hypothetical protein